MLRGTLLLLATALVALTFVLGTGAAGPATPVAQAESGCTYPEEHGGETCVTACVSARSESDPLGALGVAPGSRQAFAYCDDFWDWCFTEGYCGGGGGGLTAPIITGSPPNEISDGKIAIGWDPVANATGYECQIAPEQTTWTSCSPGQELTGFDQGDLTFKVRAKGTSGVGPETAHDFRYSRSCLLVSEEGEGRAWPPGEFSRDELIFGPVAAKGCFAKVDGKVNEWKANAPTVLVNGLTLYRGAAELKFLVDADRYQIVSTGNVRVKLGPFTIWHGPINWKFKDTNSLSLALSKEFTGVGLMPSAKLEFSRGATKAIFSVVIKDTGKISFVKSRKYSTTAKAFSGELVMQATNDKPSLDFESGQVTIDEMSVLSLVDVENLTFKYVASKKEWSAAGKATITKLPGQPGLSLAAAVNQGGLSALSGEIALGKGVPLGTTGAFLQRLRLSIGLSDDGSQVTVGGGMGISGGPKLPIVGSGEQAAVEIDGDLAYTFPAAGKKGVWKISSPESGGLKVFGYPLAGGWLTVSDDAKYDFEGTAQFNALDAPNVDKTKKPGVTQAGQKKQPPAYWASAHLLGWFEGTSYFNASGAVTAMLPGLGRVSGNAVASAKGLVACFGDPGKRVGFAREWTTGNVHGYGLPFQPVCDVSKWRTPRTGAPKAPPKQKPAPPIPQVPRPGRPVPLAYPAATSKTLYVGADQSITQFEFTGEPGAAPRVTISGPGGKSLTVGPDGEGRGSAGFGFANDLTGVTTVTLLDPGSGVWKAKSDVGVERIRQADELPLPALRSTVGGSGAQRTLAYTVADHPGQEIVWTDRESGTVLGRTTNARGTLKFAPADGPAQRTIVAQVVQDGFPRIEQVVGTYTVGGTALAAPKGLKAKRRGKNLAVTWAAVPGAAKYRVTVDLKKGRDKSATVSAAKATVKGVKRGAGTVRVAALAADGTPGSAASAKLKR